MSKKKKYLRPEREDEESTSSEPLGVNEISPVEVEADPARAISTCCELVSVSHMAERIQMLKDVSVSVGVRRAEFKAALSTLADDEPAITIGYDGVYVSVNRLGDPLFDEKGALARYPSGVSPKLACPTPGSAPGNKKIGSMIVPSGSIGILAGGGHGKSPLATALAAEGVKNFSMVRVGEPLAGYASSSLSKESIAYSIAVAMLDSSDVVIDSIKDLLSSGGNLMKSGLSRGALITLSDWASAACDAGCSLYIPINPSDTSDEVLELMIQAGKTNTTSLITVQNGNTWTYYNRTGESLPRITGTLDLTFGADGVAKVTSGAGSPSPISERAFSKVVTTILTKEAISFAARRALSLDNESE